MKKFTIEENTNNLSSKQRFYDDMYLNKLIDLLCDIKEYSDLHEYVRDMFYFQSVEEYQQYLPNVLLVNEESYDLIMEIYNIFIEWNVFNKYNLGELRGNYLEILLFKYLQEEHLKNNIHKEVRIIIGNYRSHTWDVVLELQGYLNLFEAKFSSKVLKRKHIDKMISLHNQLSDSRIFLVSYEQKDVLMDSLLKLREDTNQTKYDNMLKKINLISIENFNKHEILTKRG